MSAPLLNVGPSPPRIGMDQNGLPGRRSSGPRVGRTSAAGTPRTPNGTPSRTTSTPGRPRAGSAQGRAPPPTPGTPGTTSRTPSSGGRTPATPGTPSNRYLVLVQVERAALCAAKDTMLKFNIINMLYRYRYRTGMEHFRYRTEYPAAQRIMRTDTYPDQLPERNGLS